MATEGIKFLHRFSVGDYNTTFPGVNILSVTSTAAGDFDKKNLTTTPLREVWRSATASTTQSIIIEANDLTTVPDIFAILNHNLTDLAVVHLQASVSDPTFLAPAITIQFNWNEKHLLIVQDLGTPYRYYKIKITDPTNPCGYIQIGRIVAGRAFTFTKNEDITDDIKLTRDDLAYKMKSEGFFRAANERVKVRKLSVKFQRLRSKQGIDGNDENFAGLNDLFENVGESYPLLTIVDPADPYFVCLWGKIDSLPTDDYDVNRYVTLSFAIQEEY